ncbi:phage major capsid protein [Priestia aryabhattai]|uniref:major capsid protein n=1 Tax=Priestia aryabhattai TaxID=412384 RepID=UPI002041A542|nr:phage major capsid protein [Priestia aryabhattai]MCM3639703.1 phage major capsid protein [Priestia aryabhattai]
MAGITINQSADLTNDTLQAGVIETMATESKLLAILPFMTVQGHGYSYNVETDLAGVEFREINTAYNTVPPQTERRTEFLTILGGEAIVDSFQLEVHSNINDLMAVETALTAKSIAHKYEQTFLNGDVAKDSKAFNGLIKRATDKGTFIEKGDLVDDLDEMLDKVQGGADAIIMNKKTRRALTKVAREQIEYKTNEFGVQVAHYGGLPIIDVEAELLADDIVFAVKFGVHEAVAGLQSRSGVHVKSLGELGETPQVKTRIEWFCGLAIFNDRAICMRKGVASA